MCEQTLGGWFLKKEWIDREEDIQAVHILLSCAPLGQPCDLEKPRRRLPLAKIDRSPGTDAGKPVRVTRQRVIPMPGRIWDAERNEWTAQYALHYRYEIFQKGRRWSSETICEEIVYRDLEYVDWEGRLSSVGIYWCVGDWGAPTWSVTEDARFVEAFGVDHERLSHRLFRFADKPRFAVEKWNLMKQLPLPWRWSARIYAPKGSAVRQRWHIGNLSPGVDWEGWDPHSPGDFVHFL